MNRDDVTTEIRAIKAGLRTLFPKPIYSSARSRRRRLLTVGVAVAFPVVALSGVGYAFWAATGTGTGTTTTGTLTAPGKPAGSVAGSTVTLSWGTATVAGNGSITYAVQRRSSAGSTFTSACGASVVSGSSASCQDSPGSGSWIYRVNAAAASWTSQSPESDVVVVNSTGAPAAPTSVTLGNGAGAGSAYVNNTTKASANVTVALSSSSIASNSVHLTVSDAGTAHSVTPTAKSAPAGAGNVSFTGLDLTTLNDGALTLTAWVTNSSNASSTNTTNATLVTKDVVAPTATVTPAASSPTNSQPINFGLVFSENMQTVTATQISFGIPAADTGATKSVTAGTDAAHWTATVSGLLTDGTGDGNVSTTVSTTATDVAGNALSTSSTGTVVWDRTAPTAQSANAPNNGTSGKAEAGDTVTFAYSEAMNPASIVPSSVLSSWNGTSLNVVVRGGDGGSSNDSVTVWDASNNTQLNLGTLTLGGKSYFGTGGATFGAAGTPSTMSFDAAKKVVTVTLGTAAGSISTSASSDKGSLSWTPSTSATDAAGNAAGASSWTGGGNNTWF